MKKRLGFVLLALVAISMPVTAADYPSRPIKLVVPYVAGGPTDAQARLLAEYMSRDLKQNVIIENKGGAQGAIGAEAVAHSEPDGYTLLFTTSSVILLNPVLYKKLSYDPARELRMLALVADLPMVMVVHPSVPAKSIAEFVDYAKRNPGKLNFGSAGAGSAGQLAGEMFKQATGIDMTHVPYKGSSAALTDLLSGQIQVMFESVGITISGINAGLLRPLGVSSIKRLPDLPDVPTIADSGYPDYHVSVWYGVAAPAKVSEDIVQKISASVNKALGDEAFRTKLTKASFPPLQPQSEADVGKFIEADRARWADIVRTLHITLD